MIMMRGAIRLAVFVALIAGTGLTDLHVFAQRGPVKAPRRIKDVKPVYPPASLAAGDEGAVLVELKIAASGGVTSARVIWTRCPALNEAALTAARLWRFEEVKVNGTPMAYTMVATVPFRLPTDIKSRAGSPGSCVWKDPPTPTM